MKRYGVSDFLRAIKKKLEPSGHSFTSTSLTVIASSDSRAESASGKGGKLSAITTPLTTKNQK